MSSSATALALDGEQATPRARPWVASLVQLVLVGGGTAVLFPLSWILRQELGLDAAELAVGAVMFHAAHVINDPHFAVTYLLFYRDARARATSADIPRAQRARWWIAGVVVPIVLVGWAALALVTRSAQTLGWMIQLMFLLVGWHYAKQGFGVLAVLSAHRGVRWSPRERAVVLAHCYVGWAYAWASPSSAAGEFVEKGVVYWAIERPRWLELATGALLVASTIALVLVLARKWHRERTIAAAPLAAFLITIWCWTIFSALDPLVRYAIPALHSIQYLYFVWLMRRNEARAHEGAPHFGRPAGTKLAVLAVSAIALGYVLLRGGPELLDLAFPSDPDAPLGATPMFAALFVIVNVHHYFMDHVIWRRESPDAKWLTA